MDGYQKAWEIIGQVKQVIQGKDACIQKLLAAMLAGGHILIDDIPGVGKTTMALAFAGAMRLSYSRMQFTPDVLPSDVTGFYLYEKERGQFRYQPGPVMCQLFLADEINRTSPKTQSALLEVMEEGQVTLEGRTHPVPNPFTVIATQNPVGSAGTQLLPDSQLDRFCICLTVGYPSQENEMQILKGRQQGNPLELVNPVANADDLLFMQRQVEQIFVHDAILKYITSLAKATREHPYLALGLSPRGSLALCRMAKASAYLSGRDYVLPEDVAALFPDVARHRLILSPRAKASHVTVPDIMGEILKQVPGPTLRGR
ncbi:AAA family ATPase [Hominifimenecus sp. rT4P-3]|uniref:AAA family ATPase n=1 Tax=Hominifimenecus sp. rT4P-3 TaxID=3242979 RepID=UPI003DA354F4